MKVFRHILILLSLIYAAILMLLTFTADWPRSLWWLANVIEIMPIWLWGVPLILFMAASIMLKSGRLFILQVISVIVLLFGVMAWQMPAFRNHPEALDARKIRVLSLNMGSETRLDDLSALIKRAEPDVIAVQECSADKFETLKKSLPPDWSFHAEGSGLALASRFPIESSEARSREPLGGWGNFIRSYALRTPSGILNFFNVHLETPRAGVEALIEKKFSGIKEMKAVTKLQETESLLASQLTEKSKNVIVAGDFNMQIKNPIFHKYWSNLTDAFSAAGKGFGYTKHTSWHGVRIDHILADNSWSVGHFYTGPDVGSDHHPVIADLIQKEDADDQPSQSGSVLPSESLPPQLQTEESPSKPARTAAALPEKPVYKEGAFPVFIARITDKSQRNVLVSSGIPFAPGQLTDARMFSILDEQHKEIPMAVRVLARWPEDQSIRSVLVQFSYPISKKLRKLLFQWGAARTSDDLDIVEPEWDYPEAMILMPPQWLCDSRIIGQQVPFGIRQFRNYDAKIEEHYQRLRDIPWANDIGHDNYYDTPHTYYQFYVRSGLLAYFLDARRELLHYRDTLILQEGPDRGMAKSGNQTRYVYIEAMADDYLLTGDARSLKVAGYMREYLKKKFQPSKAFYPKNSKSFWTEREPAFPLLGVLIYYELTGDPEDLEWAREVFDNLYKTQLQWPDRGGFIHNLYAHDPEEGCKPDEYGGSPFMAGFLLEAIIKYHQITGDPRAADSIFRAVDWMIHEGMVPARDTFRYLTCSAYEPEDGAPDLNLAIVHAYGYAYRLTGYRDADYLELGQRILNRGVRDGWMGDRKHFNQQFRSSGHYLAYILDALTVPPASAGGGSQEDSGVPVAIIGQHYTSSFSASLPQDYLNLERFPELYFKYRVQPGEALGVKVETHFGDWLCLGGTRAFICDSFFVLRPVLFIDDGQWHDVSLNMKDLVRTRLQSTKFLDTVRFQYDSSLGEGFDLDQLEIRPAKPDNPPEPEE